MSLFAKEYLLIHTKVFYGLGEVKIRLSRDFNNKISTIQLANQCKETNIQISAFVLQVFEIRSTQNNSNLK